MFFKIRSVSYRLSSSIMLKESMAGITGKTQYDYRANYQALGKVQTCYQNISNINEKLRKFDAFSFAAFEA